MDPRSTIRDRALALGFDAIGMARAELGAEIKAGLSGFLAAGHHGDMGWLKDKATRRGDPQVLWPQARSVIALGLNYGPGEDPLDGLGHAGSGNISVYARNRDYHDTLKKRLKVLAHWIAENFAAEVKVFVDTAPVMEKPLAAQAGIGWQGKHTNLVSRELGSWLFLGEIFTTLELPPDNPEADHCGECRRCLDICPTQAFPAPYRLDARRCISYLTIEHKGPIPRELRAPIGNRIYGCDDCLAICPWNKFARTANEADFQPRADLVRPGLGSLATLDDAGFRRMFSGSPIKRLGRDRFLRNVLIAIGNSGQADLADCARPHLADPSPLVRGAAIWALSRLLDREKLHALRQRHIVRETDSDVLQEWEWSIGAGD